MLADKGSMLLFCNEHPVYPTPFFFKSLLSPWMAFGTLVGNHLTIHGSWFAKSCLTNLQPHGLQPHQDPLSMEFSRQEYWSGLPFPSSGDLPHPGIKPTSLNSATLEGGFFTPVLPGISQRPGQTQVTGTCHHRPCLQCLLPTILGIP